MLASTVVTCPPVVAAIHGLSQERERLYARLRREVEERLTLREVTSATLARRGHRSIVWDATTLPTESHYLPVFLDILAGMEERGEARPETHLLVETTTGNAGAAAAYLARELGYPILIFMPEDLPRARIRDVEKNLPEGSEVRLTEAGAYVAGMVRELRHFLARHRDGYRGRQVAVVNHSRRPESVAAIASAVERLLRDAGGELVVDTAVVALGNGTTATGVSKAVRSLFPGVEVVGVEPLESPWFYTQKFGPEEFQRRYGAEPKFHPHQLIGTGGWGVQFPNLDLELLDNILLVAEDAWRWSLHSLQERGLAVGHTSAACQAVVEELSMLREGQPQTFLSMFYDPLKKY